VSSDPRALNVRHRLTAACVALLVACGGSPGPRGGLGISGSWKGAPTAKLRLTDADAEKIVHEVAIARQLTPTRPVAIVRVDHARFIDHLLHDANGESGGTGGSNPNALSPEAAFLLAFDFVPPPGQRGGIASTDDVLEEQVAGYYDLRRDQIFLPDRALKTESELLEQRAVLAHEVQHALQAQRFPRTEEDKKPTSSDAALARLALMEGDAMVAMGATMGSLAGAPVGRTLRRIVEETKKVPLATVTRGEHRQKLDAALEVTRRRLLFPYEDGMLFVSDVYRAGGFPLVDHLYERPPTSTEQILHPEKYLAGETAHAVRDPEAPAGYKSASVDTLGELATRVLLSRCVPPPDAREAASGWAGDRYAVFAGPEGRLAVLWVSAWDTEHDAQEVADALSAARGRACWHENALEQTGQQTGQGAISADTLVKRRGKVVAFERGLPAATRERLVDGLFPLVGPEPPRVPLTDLPIPPRVPLPEPEPGSLEDDVYDDDWLGITGRVPPGMQGELGKETGLQLLVSRPNVIVRGGLAFSTRVSSAAQDEVTFGEIASGLAIEAAKGGAATFVVGGGAVDTPLGKGKDRIWRVGMTTIEERVVLIPICAGTGAIAFVELYGDSYARSVLDGWIGSFRWQHGRSVTACDYLDPK
jgi:hypothetical protein